MFVIRVKDRLPDRHFRLNLYLWVMKFSHSVNTSACLFDGLFQYIMCVLSVSVSHILCAHNALALSIYLSIYIFCLSVRLSFCLFTCLSMKHVKDVSSVIVRLHKGKDLFVMVYWFYRFHSECKSM